MLLEMTYPGGNLQSTLMLILILILIQKGIARKMNFETIVVACLMFCISMYTRYYNHYITCSINTNNIISLDKKKFQKKDEKWNLAVLCTDIFDTVIESHLRASLTVPYYKEIMHSSAAGSPVARAGLHMIQYCGQEKNFLKLIYQSALSLGNHHHFLVDHFYYHYHQVYRLFSLHRQPLLTLSLSKA